MKSNLNIIFFSKDNPSKEALVFNGDTFEVLEKPFTKIKKNEIYFSNLSYDFFRVSDLKIPENLKYNSFFGYPMEKISSDLGVSNSVKESMEEIYRITNEVIKFFLDNELTTLDSIYSSRKMYFSLDRFENSYDVKNKYIPLVKMADLTKSFNSNIKDVDFVLEISNYKIFNKVIELLGKDFKMISKKSFSVLNDINEVIPNLPKDYYPFFQLEKEFDGIFYNRFFSIFSLNGSLEVNVEDINKIVLSSGGYEDELGFRNYAPYDSRNVGSFYYETLARIFLDFLYLKNIDNFNSNIIEAVQIEEVNNMYYNLSKLNGVKIKNVFNYEIHFSINSKDLDKELIDNISNLVSENCFVLPNKFYSLIL